jgi:hypothetical protein
MAAGKSMALILSDTSIGTQEAAEFLEVSRPYVVRLPKNGESKLNFLARQAQELNLGYSNE